jgi:hypothetical protein
LQRILLVVAGFVVAVLVGVVWQRWGTMPANEWMTLVKDFVLVAIPVATALIAYLGLSKWRQELRGKADFEAARNLIRAAYKLREQIQDSRAPLVRANEFPESYDSGASTPSDEAGAWAHVYRNRMRPVSEALQEFDAHTLEAEALWGASVRKSAEALRQCVADLYGAVDGVVGDKQSGGEDFKKSDPQFGPSMRSTVHGNRNDDKNAFNQKLAAALQGIEKELRPHLKRPAA